MIFIAQRLAARFGSARPPNEFSSSSSSSTPSSHAHDRAPAPPVPPPSFRSPNLPSHSIAAPFPPPRSPVVPPRSPVAPPRSPLAPPRSPLAPPRSPLAPPRSPLAPPHSPLASPLSPSFPHHQPTKAGSSHGIPTAGRGLASITPGAPNAAIAAASLASPHYPPGETPSSPSPTRQHPSPRPGAFTTLAPSPLGHSSRPSSSGARLYHPASSPLKPSQRDQLHLSTHGSAAAELASPLHRPPSSSHRANAQMSPKAPVAPPMGFYVPVEPSLSMERDSRAPMVPTQATGVLSARDHGKGDPYALSRRDSSATSSPSLWSGHPKSGLVHPAEQPQQLQQKFTSRSAGSAPAVSPQHPQASYHGMARQERRSSIFLCVIVDWSLKMLPVNAPYVWK